jgi:hypothetical protein
MTAESRHQRHWHDIFPEDRGFATLLLFVILNIVAPFGALAHVISLDHGRLGRWLSIIFKILSLVILFIAAANLYNPLLSAIVNWFPAGEAQIAAEAWLQRLPWLLIGSVANVYVLIHLYAVSTHEKCTTSLGKSVTGLAEGLIGHKIWAEPDTHALLNTLISDQAGRRAKWFLITFLSSLVDDRISVPSALEAQYYKIVTPAEGWEACRYSRFLAENMGHAQDSVVWITDPVDFFSVLLPEMTTYTLAAIPVAVFDSLPDIGPCTPNIPYDAFGSLLKGSAKKLHASLSDVTAVAGLDSKSAGEQLDLGHLLKTRQYDRAWSGFHSLVLRPLQRLGSLLYIHGHRPRKYTSEWHNAFRRLRQEYLGELLPHISAFGSKTPRCHRRVICFWGGQGSGQEWLEERVRFFTSKYVRTWHGENRRLQSFPVSAGSWRAAFSKDVVLRAIEFFTRESGGEDRISVSRIKLASPPYIPNGSRVPMDIGIYDSKYVVWSWPACRPGSDSSDSGRIVNWYYLPDVSCPDPDDHNTMKSVAWYDYWRGKLMQQPAVGSNTGNGDHESEMRKLAYGATAALGSNGDTDTWSMGQLRKAVEKRCLT